MQDLSQRLVTPASNFTKCAKHSCTNYIVLAMTLLKTVAFLTVSKICVYWPLPALQPLSLIKSSSLCTVPRVSYFKGR